MHGFQEMPQLLREMIGNRPAAAAAGTQKQGQEGILSAPISFSFGDLRQSCSRPRATSGFGHASPLGSSQYSNWYYIWVLLCILLSEMASYR